MNIKISNLSFSYAKLPVLQNINLEFKSDDFLCIIGPNGGGKSTLLKLILGLLDFKNGSIEINGENPKKYSKFIGYVPQNIPLNSAFPMTAISVVLMGRLNSKSFGFYNKNDKILALEALQKVSMSEFANKKISDLSGGQRQRIYIARALASGAKILILDEPTASIDPKGQTEIYSLLRELNESGIGILMVSHDINMAMGFAKKIAYINRELVLHDTYKLSDPKEIKHLAHKGEHFCDVELAEFWSKHV